MQHWYTYIIYSKKLDKFYTGFTENIQLRIERHNNGWSKFTKNGIPWELVYYEVHDSKQEALKREREIKMKKSKHYIERLINHAGDRSELTELHSESL